MAIGPGDVLEPVLGESDGLFVVLVNVLVVGVFEVDTLAEGLEVVGVQLQV